MGRAIFGLIKGLVVGGAVAYGLLWLGWTGGVWAYLGCALVGALVGVVCGKPPWRSETLWTPVVKMIVGAAIGAGLCAIALKLLPDHALVTLGQNIGLPSKMDVKMNDAPVAALVIGALYGLFVEVDDGGKGAEKSDSDKPAKKKSA